MGGTADLKAEEIFAGEVKLQRESSRAAHGQASPGEGFLLQGTVSSQPPSLQDTVAGQTAPALELSPAASFLQPLIWML